MTQRDITTNPYSPDEQRVADYIAEQTQGHVGAGDDPIDFLMMSHSYLAAENRVLRKETSDTKPASDPQQQYLFAWMVLEPDGKWGQS